MCPRGRIVTGKPRCVHTHGGALLHDKREKCLNAATQTLRGAQLHSQAQQAACRTTPGTDDAQDGRRGGGAARAGGGTRNGSFVSPRSPAAWRPDHRIETIPSSAREGHNKGGPTRARAGRGPDPGHAHPPLGGGSRPHEGANAVRTGTERSVFPGPRGEAFRAKGHSFWLRRYRSVCCSCHEHSRLANL